MKPTPALIATAIMLSLLSAGARGAEQCVSTTSSYADVLERVGPAIVSVYSTPTQDLGRTSRSKNEQEEIASFASGVIVDSAGLVATSSHGLQGDWPIRVTLGDKREFDAEIVLMDRRTDLALLRLKGAQGLATVEIGDSDEVRVGDFVLAIGNPYGVGQTVTHGLVSAVGRTQLQLSDYEYYIQTDAAMNPGSSGGALLDTRGRLIGINTAIATQTRGWQGIGFAVPANMVSFVLATARSGGKVVRRPWLGAKLVPLDPGSAVRLGMTRRVGALVKDVMTDGPAARGGLRTDDIIASLDDKPIEDPNAFDYRFAMKGLSGFVHLGILRNGAEEKITVSLEAAPDLVPRESTRIRTPSLLQGAMIANLSPALAEELGLDSQVEGVVVIDVERGSTAQKFGLRPGDVLLTVNGAKIGRVRDVERLLRNTRLATLEFDRGGDIFFTRVTRQPDRR